VHRLNTQTEVRERVLGPQRKLTVSSTSIMTHLEDEEAESDRLDAVRADVESTEGLVGADSPPHRSRPPDVRRRELGSDNTIGLIASIQAEQLERDHQLCIRVGRLTDYKACRPPFAYVFYIEPFHRVLQADIQPWAIPDDFKTTGEQKSEDDAESSSDQ